MDRKMPAVLSSARSDSGAATAATDNDVEVLGSTPAATDVLVDWPHARSDCGRFPFATDPAKYCSKCYCYVCDTLVAHCVSWTTHHPASKNDAGWRQQRRLAKGNHQNPVAAAATVTPAAAAATATPAAAAAATATVTCVPKKGQYCRLRLAEACDYFQTDEVCARAGGECFGKIAHVKETDGTNCRIRVITEYNQKVTCDFPNSGGLNVCLLQECPLPSAIFEYANGTAWTLPEMIEPGDLVVGRFQRGQAEDKFKEEWFRCRVARVYDWRGQSFFDLAYDDGAYEQCIPLNERHGNLLFLERGSEHKEWMHGLEVPLPTGAETVVAKVQVDPTSGAVCVQYPNGTLVPSDDYNVLAMKIFAHQKEKYRAFCQDYPDQRSKLFYNWPPLEPPPKKRRRRRRY